MADDSRESLATTMASDSAQVPTTAAKTPAPQEPPKPKSSLAAWSKVLGGFLIFVNTWGIASGYGVFQSYYQEELFPWESPSAVSWIGSVQAFLLVILGLFTGTLYDMGFFQHLQIVGNLLVILGMFMLSLSTTYYQVLLSQGVCFGLGSGLLYVPTIAFVATEFPTKRIFAVGLASTGSAFGGVIYPIMFRQLQPRIGFGNTVRVIASIAVVVAIAAGFLLHPLPKRPAARRKLFQFHAWTELPFIFFSLALFLGFLAFWVPFVYVPTYAQLSLKTNDDIAFYMLSVVNAGSFFGRIIPSYLAQSFGPMQVFMSAMIACSALLFGWIGVENLAGYIVIAALFGFFSGVLVSVPPATVAHPVLSPSMAVVGTRLGMLWSMTGLGVLVGSPIAGAFIDPTSKEVSFLGAQVFAGVCMAGAAVLLIVPFVAIIRYDRRRSSATTDVETVVAPSEMQGAGAVEADAAGQDGSGESGTEKGSEAEKSGVEHLEGDGDSKTVRNEDSEYQGSELHGEPEAPDRPGAGKSRITPTTDETGANSPGRLSG